MRGADQRTDSSDGADDRGQAGRSHSSLVGGLLLVGTGIPVSLLSGAFSVFFAMSFLEQFQMERQISWDILGFSLLVAFAPFLFGLLLIVLGIRTIRKRRRR